MSGAYQALYYPGYSHIRGKVCGWLVGLGGVDGTLACVHGQANGLNLTGHPGHNEGYVISLGGS